MAVFGRDYYGRAKYGGRARAEMAVDPFEAEVYGFDTVALRWSEPGGDWAGFRLLRSRTGFPITETDGEIIIDYPPGSASATGQQHVDTHRQGGWHYYAIFLFEDGSQTWERAAAIDILVPYDFKSTDKVWDSIPEYYKSIRDDGVAGYSQSKYRINPAIYLNNEETVPNLTLSKYLHIFGWGMDILRSQVEQIRDGYDIEAVHVNRLALLAQQFGAEVEDAAPANINRNMVRNLGYLYRKRGTLEGIREMVSLVTGWEADVTLGPNLMLSEDQSNFVNPEPQLWDHTVKYATGDRVKYQRNLFEAKKTAYGNLQAPPVTRTSNEWWDADKFVEPVDDRSVARTDTGDISTWQIDGPNGFQSGGTFIGRGTVDPEDGSLNYTNSLAFKNTTGAVANFNVRSIPRHKDNLTSWSKRLVIESGIPIPRATKPYVSGTRYRAGDLVMYEGAPYEAVTTTEAAPTDTTRWKKMGHDDRVRMCLSFFSHGPYSGTVNTGGLKTHALVTEFDENGDMLTHTICNPASFAGTYYDPFNAIGTLVAGRVPAKGAAWGANGVGTWGINRDDEGGYTFPPTTGRSYQLAPATTADTNVAVTYKSVPAGTRLLGLVFRWSDASNFWIATQTGLFKVVAGAARANPASGAVAWTTFKAGERLRVSLSGSTITVFRDGTQVGTATDAFNSTATRHGVEVEA